jgi:hypothetical protein
MSRVTLRFCQEALHKRGLGNDNRNNEKPMTFSAKSCGFTLPLVAKMLDMGSQKK